MREVQQKPSWNEPEALDGEDPALRTVHTFIMLERRRRRDFTIDAILNYDP